MRKIYLQHFYPNPFRSRNLENAIDQTEIFEEISDTLEPFLGETLEPFLPDKFFLIHNFVDEFGNLKSQTRIIRFLQRKAIDLYHHIEDRFNQKRILKPAKIAVNTIYNITSNQLKKLNTINNYNQNLRYLELPLQPITDTKGFEIQFLSEDILENTIEEIDEGYRFVYDYCSKMFPESIDLWSDYALLEPNDFPFISHDDLLDSTYEIFEKIFDDLQKNSPNLVSWVISGDLNTRLLKIIKPKIEVTKISPSYIILVLESVLSLTILLIILKYVISHSKTLLFLKEPLSEQLGIKGIKTYLSDLNLDIHYATRRFIQKSKKLKSKITDLKFSLKYKIVKTLVGTSNL